MVAHAVPVVADWISSAAAGGRVCGAEATGTHRQRATPDPGWICPTTCRGQEHQFSRAAGSPQRDSPYMTTLLTLYPCATCVGHVARR